MEGAAKQRGRKRGAHEHYVRQAFISSITPKGLQLAGLAQYDKAGCLWKCSCSTSRHVLYRQVQTIARTPNSLNCRVCAEECSRRSSNERLLYKQLDEMPSLGPYAVESHVLRGLGVEEKSAFLSLRRHATDVWLVGVGKVLIELDGRQHTDNPIHGASMACRAALDAAVDAAAVLEGWWVVRVTPGRGTWLKKAKAAILAACYEAQYGGRPRVIAVSC
jgi:very-short-patch-repair endonuclease